MTACVFQSGAGKNMHRRFFIEQSIGDSKEIVLKDKDILRQLVSVFRAKRGDDIVLFDNSGFEFSGIIKDANKKEIIVGISGKTAGAKINKEISVFQSVIKKDKFEIVLEKCAEIGASRFVPVLSRHCVKLNLNFARLRKIAKEASEQCGRAKLPEILETVDFKKAVEAAKSEKGAVNFIFHNKKFVGALSCEFLSNFAGVKKINLFIGPEGGFSDEEMEFAENKSFYALSLGNLTLRSETAAIAAAAFVSRWAE